MNNNHNKNFLAIAAMVGVLIGGALFVSSTGNAFARSSNSQATSQDEKCGNGDFPFNPQCLNVDASSIGDGSAQAPVGLQEGGFAIRIVNVTINNVTTINTFSIAHLTVIIHVINDNGGTSAAKDFTISVSGTNVSPQGSFQGAESPGTTLTLSPGSFSVSETGPAGYSQSMSGDCSGSISSSESKTCTITNNDNPPSTEKGTLMVIKHIIGGPATASDFDLFLGTGNANLSRFPGEEAPGTKVTLDAGSNYAVSEINTKQFLFYVAGRSADCVGTINPSETKTCNFTNTYTPPPSNIAHLNVIVRVDNTGCLNQCAQASDFPIQVGGGSPIYYISPSYFPGSEQGTDVTITVLGTGAGQYSAVVGLVNPQFSGKYHPTYDTCLGYKYEAGNLKPASLPTPSFNNCKPA